MYIYAMFSSKPITDYIEMAKLLIHQATSVEITYSIL